MLSPLVSITHDGAGALGGLQQQDVQGLTLIVQHQVQRVCLTSHPVTAPGSHPAIICQLQVRRHWTHLSTGGSLGLARSL